MKIAVVCTGALLLGVVAGCGGSSASDPLSALNSSPAQLVAPPATALVKGSLLLVGGPAPGKARPVAGTVVFTSTQGAVATTDVDATGRFAIGLAPGDYVITGSSPAFVGGEGECRTAQKVTTLTLTGDTTADVICSVR